MTQPAAAAAGDVAGALELAGLVVRGGDAAERGGPGHALGDGAEAGTRHPPPERLLGAYDQTGTVSVCRTARSW